jgi:hypothetical protein
LLEAFIKAQLVDNQNLPNPPIRVVVVGDDKQFGKFVRSYISLLDLDTSGSGPSRKRKGDRLNDDLDGAGSGDRNGGSSGFSIDKQKLDLRVFLIP